MNNMEDLKSMKPKKDTQRAIVNINGFRANHRVINAKFPAAYGSPLIRLALSRVSAHSFSVIQDFVQEDGATIAIYTIVCSSLAHDGQGENTSYEIAAFEDEYRAKQALTAIEVAMNSNKKLWIVFSVILAIWVILFMPLQNAPQSVRASMNSYPNAANLSSSMGSQRIPVSAGLLAPPISVLGSPGLPGSAAVLTPGLTPVPAQTASSEANSSSDDDPFGLKISSTPGTISKSLTGR